MRYFLILLLWPALAIAVDPEDFEITEEGVKFDYPRTGLLYERRVYIEGDEVTFTPYYPTGYNDTRYIKKWKFYIEKWQQDPPNAVIVYVRDDTPYHYRWARISLRAQIGQLDPAGNLVPSTETILQDIPIHKGLNRVPIYIHNYKGDIVRIHLVGVRMKLPYAPVSFTEED